MARTYTASQKATFAARFNTVGFIIVAAGLIALMIWGGASGHPQLTTIASTALVAVGLGYHAARTTIAKQRAAANS